MGNTFKTGNYVNGIFQDSSNNIGIGASPSGTYKFEVTGTAKVSGILTLGSTISNGTYAYTLPSATGTLALTSDLSSYVPYTGATGAVNLGYNYLAASNLDIDGYSFGDGGALNFKQFASLAVKGSGYTSIGARSTNIFTFSYNQAGLTSKAFSFDVSGLTTSVYKTYLMPNANGTLALTSDLSAYLPLAGGTLTGALGGTSASFSGGVSADVGSAIPSIQVKNVSTDAPFIGFYRGGTLRNTFQLLTDGSFRLTDASLVANAGLTMGALSGTSATFSQSANSYALKLLNNAGYPSIIDLSTTTATSTARNWAIFTNGTNWGDLEFKPSAANGGDPYTTGTVALRIASTGAATFSSSVTATQGNFSLGTVGGAIGSVKNLTVTNSNGAVGDWTGINFAYYNNTTNFAYIGSVLTSDAGNSKSDLVFGVKASTGSTSVTEYMRIQSGGNLGVGTSSPSTKLQVEDGYISTYHNINANGAGYGLQFYTNGGGSKNTIATIDISQVGTARSGILIFNTSDAGAPSEKMRIASDGNVIVGGTNAVGKLTVIDNSVKTTSDIPLAIGSNNPTASQMQLIFYRNINLYFNIQAIEQGTAYRSIYLNLDGGAVYAGTQRIDNNSDARVKENIQPVTNALDTILSLNGKKFNMIDEDNILRYGFIAQEVQPILNDFVTESTRNYKDGNNVIENLLTLETSGAAWAALLVEAIKEQQKQIEELKLKIK